MKDASSLLLISPKFFGYEKEIKSELESQLNGEVIYHDTRPKNDFLTKVIMRFGMTYLIRTKINEHQEMLIEKIADGNYKTVLFINPEGFDNDFFERLKAVVSSVNLILYLWDSVGNKPLIKPVLKQFNKIYSFDKTDCENYGFTFLPLFFSQHYSRRLAKVSKPVNDITFIGTVHSQRMNVIKKVMAFAAANNYCFYNYLYIQSRIVFYARKIFDKNFTDVSAFTFHFTPLSVDEIKKIYENTTAILDVEHDKQRGLTMRTFESLGAGIKLITTNKNIRDYDIYDENNVLVIDKDTVTICDKFLKTPFRSYPQDIIGKYSLSSWVNTLLSTHHRGVVK